MLFNINCQEIKYCCGPCNNNDIEKPGVLIDDNLKYILKPHDGKRYRLFMYTLLNEDILYLKNLRLCRECLNRYDESDYFNLDKKSIYYYDGVNILKKIINNKSIISHDIKEYISNIDIKK